MKKLLSDSKVRKSIYEEAFYLFQATLRHRGRYQGMCYYLEVSAETYLKIHNIHKMDVNWQDYNIIELCPEIMKHKPEVVGIESMGFWFHRSNSYLREKILEQAIQEITI